jgi:hypothetical protein
VRDPRDEDRDEQRQSEREDESHSSTLIACPISLMQRGGADVVPEISALTWSGGLLATDVLKKTHEKLKDTVQ